MESPGDLLRLILAHPSPPLKENRLSLRKLYGQGLRSIRHKELVSPPEKPLKSVITEEREDDNQFSS